MKDKELLLEAIDSYDLLPPTGKMVLKTLIKLAIDDIIDSSITDLSKLSKVSRQSVYNALDILDNNGFIKRSNIPGSRFSSFALKIPKLNTIIEYYTIRQNLLHE